MICDSITSNNLYLSTSLLTPPRLGTSFLPDKDRDQSQLKERERLQQEWLGQQAVVKNEVINVFSTQNPLECAHVCWI